MIKNLLDADDEPPISAPAPEKITIEENEVNPRTNEMLVHDDDGQITTTKMPREIFEIPEDAKFFTTIPEVSEAAATPEFISHPEPVKPAAEPFEQTWRASEEPNQINDLLETEVVENPQIQTPNSENLYAEIVNDQEAKKTPPVDAPILQSSFTPETPDETARKSGMAYSAAVVLIASIVFTMILGWGADLLLGTSPWGIVGGVILGSIIGFIQFFRITSSILK